MEKTCLKCSHVNPNALGAYTDACPQCGAIYAKVEQLATQLLRRPVMAGAAAQRPSHFIERLRDDSHYPTFRKVITTFDRLGQVLAVLVFLGGLIGGYTTGSAAATLGATLAAIFISIFLRFAKEASLMLADMSDATVLMTVRQAGELELKASA